MGVRIVGVEQLAALLQGLSSDSDTHSQSQASSQSQDPLNKPITLPPGEWSGPAWKHAVYKPGKSAKGQPPKLAAWEASYERFRKGEHPAAIAMNQENGKTIMVCCCTSGVLLHVWCVVARLVCCCTSGVLLHVL